MKSMIKERINSLLPLDIAFVITMTNIRINKNKTVYIVGPKNSKIDAPINSSIIKSCFEVINIINNLTNVTRDKLKYNIISVVDVDIFIYY